MREQFFGQTGLTSTSANHTANLAKEFIQSQKMYLNNLCFVGKTTQAGGNSYETGVATPREQFTSISVVLDKIALATQLIAWLREALKEKTDASNNIMDFDAWCVANKVELTRPVREAYLTEAQVIKSWDINKLNAYLQAQTYASVIGEFVHPAGQYSSARKHLTDVIANPIEVEGTGQDITVITYNPVYSLEEVDKKFFELQGSQREHQAKFNQYQHEITSVVEADKAKKDNEFAKAYSEYSKAFDKAYAEYTAWKTSEGQHIADLKIVVPEALAGIYKEIQGLGK